MKARLRFYGAVQEVTGSMHLLEVNGQMIALDCGLFQGRRTQSADKNSRFPFRPQKIDAVILSHAHIDHSGRLPKLVRDGFDGPIYTTPPTRDLAEIVLADSAHIQEEDAFYWNKKRVPRGDAPIEPLYTADDAAATGPLLKAQRLNEPFEVIPGVRATLYEAGHMLGSAGIALEIDTGRKPARIVFTGDLGRPNTAILRDPAPLPACDYLLCESTYGGRTNPKPEGLRDQLADLVNKTIERRGKIVIPSFAVGRTQVIVYHLHQLAHAGRLIEPIPIYVDSPLACRATEVFRNHPEAYDREAARFNHATNNNMFDCAMCTYIENVEQSKALHATEGPMVIISASGMCEAGRILHHLKNNIEDPKNLILIVGYQAAHTLGRRLVEKVPKVRIFGEQYEVKARVKALNGFSAHADARELAEATAPLAGVLKNAFLIHGEPAQSWSLADRMHDDGHEHVTIPYPGDTFEIE